MRPHLKPIGEQVIVITGASSGIGLTTARMAARRGARVVLGARDHAAPARIADEIRMEGGEAIPVAVDVADEDQLRAVAQAAIDAFGRIDSWVNNAGVAIYGRILDTPDEDHRRLFETNYWGVVNGSKVAVEYMRNSGGALINVGSSVGDRAVPLQGVYSASKHAVKGFTVALRMELEAENLPISVTLIKPGAVDSMYEEHGKILTEHEPMNPPPIYAPETVARAILYAAEHPRRDLVVGSGGKMLSLSETLAPRLTDRLMERFLIPFEKSGGPQRRFTHSLYGPSRDGRERAGRHSMVRERSYYTEAVTHPLATGMVLAGLAALAVGAMARGGGRSDGPAGRSAEVGTRRIAARRREKAQA
ncbi:SDR family oxidoreductase [Indioceanicola profundi]|uniref:SDR family oxidoreductase n=1 Tax=Indioceanicola profundi TaxID=2220096 RepID=UPI000E6AA6C0|nr:SDR family oxidoreductase [Indioceanicola profundi]